jgi:hypothetical protein
MEVKYDILSVNTDTNGTVRLVTYKLTFTNSNLPGVEFQFSGIIEIASGLTSSATAAQLIAAVKSAMEPIQLASIEQHAANTLHYDFLQKNTTAIDKAPPTPPGEVVYPNLSPRQLWLAALEVNITKAQLLAQIDTIPDENLKARLQIELTEPPLEGYVRGSFAVETLREMVDIPVEEFNTLWLWAATI